jgi:osmotically-inducible protein OsmY
MIVGERLLNWSRVPQEAAMDDKVLRQIVIDELDFEPSIDAANIGVAVENGVVTLTGHVGSYAEKRVAERAVQRVRGVRAIAEEIAVRCPSDKKTADDQIADRAVRILDWYAQIPKGNLKVKVRNGRITLAGNVSWQYQRAAAESAVRRLSGVTGVTNLIEIIPQVQVADIKEKIFDALKRSAELEADAIRITVVDDTVILEGKVSLWYEREIAKRAAWSAPGVRAVEDRLTLDE